MSDVHCPARILLARHGETEYETPPFNAEGGSLTPLGREQARGLGERLSGGERVAGVICSDLSRAVQTAEIAAGVLGLPVKVRRGLHEYPAGDYVGKPWVSGTLEPMVTAWLTGDLTAGLPDGETGQQVVDRVVAVLDDVADAFRGESVLVVSHGGVILAMHGWLAPGADDGPHSGADVHNGASYALLRDADGWRMGTPAG